MNKKSSTPKIAALAVFSLVLLAGCRELPGKEAANNQLEQRLSGDVQQEHTGQELDNLSQEIGNDISDAMAELGQELNESSAELATELNEAMSDVQQAVQDTASVAAEHLATGSTSKELTAALEIGSSTTLNLDHAVGDIEICPAEDSTLRVKAVIITHNPLSSEHIAELLNHAEVTIKSSGDKLNISTHAKDSPKKNLWSWAQKKYGYSDFSINYVIQLPSRVENIKIHNDVGAIKLRDLQGSFDIGSDVGAISLLNVEIKDKSTVKTNTGSIALDIREMDSGSSLKAKSDVGMITASLASGLKCTVAASSELGQISGTASGKQDFNGGGPLLSLSTEIGSISVIN